MTLSLYVLLIIVFLVINFVFVRKIKNFNIDRNKIQLFHILFFSTILVRYLLNTRYYNARFEMISDEVSRAGGALGGVKYLISDLIISPYLFVSLITLFISSMLLIFNRSFKIGPLNFYSDSSRALKITIVTAYSLFWIFFIMIDLFKYGIRWKI